MSSKLSSVFKTASSITKASKGLGAAPIQKSGGGGSAGSESKAASDAARKARLGALRLKTQLEYILNHKDRLFKSVLQWVEALPSDYELFNADQKMRLGRVYYGLAKSKEQEEKFEGDITAFRAALTEKQDKFIKLCIMPGALLVDHWESIAKYYLSEWDRTFLNDMLVATYALSTKQVLKLDALFNKVFTMINIAVAVAKAEDLSNLQSVFKSAIQVREPILMNSKVLKQIESFFKQMEVQIQECLQTKKPVVVCYCRRFQTVLDTFESMTGEKAFEPEVIETDTLVVPKEKTSRRRKRGSGRQAADDEDEEDGEETVELVEVPMYEDDDEDSE